ncbi:hypothetical protein A2524_04550 [Candidatus Wolfebacteria bacterium RIFOXYD12_FULL_48_21]|uniref:PsbP C-terminal domain-containing protein n=1 Tax=Candidatus Wolfebacteria bacterium RIFOXYD1_FULL_48_65 TaxID=1802561 RepID=A0A1F8E4T8_9BACT|nr:MAG: hypothetical protein A2524_04550 [Candidatus Wolfebacteria bacterium RIFOXYD12_FULL_48_21]OGM95647.1 MAG: hypothetical protein A2610_02395 [Candidatus Wolfebacteria bacterium RIFOXYD1_FULL_48_65]OGM96749.1 MAG: hypothetical protein A2532_04155 [Candidatus Wolfebacteria bacterium RIFOXYD2_FULL_48_11]
MTKKIIIVLIVITAFALAGAIYGYRHIQRSLIRIQPIGATSTPVQTTNATTTIATTTQTNDYSGMKRYRNEEWGFEFWYPEGWEMKDKTGSAPQSSLYLSVNFLSDDTLTMDSFSISIVTPQFADYAAQGEHSSQIIVSDIIGRTYQYTLEGVSSITVDLPLHGKKMIVSAQKQHEKELYKVLSSFKFLE